MTQAATRAAPKSGRTVKAFTVPAAPVAKASWLVSQPDVPEPHVVQPDWRTLTHAQLVVSPFNVSTHAADATATAGLDASIAKFGLLQPLVVHPVAPATAGGPTIFGVFNGQRRWNALGELIARGTVPADLPVPVVVRDLSEAELIEASLHENVMRRDLRHYEIAMAVARAHAAGMPPETIAAEMGQEDVWVRRCLQLAGLHPSVFEAWAAETLSLAQAQAYAATADTVLQAEVFERLSAGPAWQHEPAKIRAALGVSDAEAARLLRFVGDDAFRDAGGRFELDLFADSAEVRGRVVDRELLRGLANDKLAEIRDAARGQHGSGLKFEVQPPRNDWGTDHALQLDVAGGELDEGRIARGEIVATLEIAESGDPLLRFWWASRAAKEGKPVTPKRAATFDRMSKAAKLADGAALRSGGGYDATAAQSANAALKESDGLTATAVETLRSLRREALRALLVDDARNALVLATVATDYLVWAQWRALETSESASSTGLAGIARSYGPTLPDAVRTVTDLTPAHRTSEAARAELSRTSWAKAKHSAESFRLFRAAPRAEKDLAAAVVVGLALERSLDADGYRVPAHDALATALLPVEDLDAATRALLPPSAAFLALLPKAELLDLVRPWVGAVETGKLQQLKRDALVDEVANLLGGNRTRAKGDRESAAAQAWVHPTLKFAAEGRTLAQTFGAAA